MSQESFAERIGLKWHQIKDVETYKTKPSVEIIANIVSAFSVSADTFLQDAGTTPEENSATPPLREKQFPFMTGHDRKGWTEENYMADRLLRHKGNQIRREDRIFEYLQQRPEIKEDLFERAVKLEILLIKNRIIEKIKDLEEEKKRYIIENLCTSENEEAEDIIRRLDLDLLYYVLGRYLETVEPIRPQTASKE